MRQSQRIVDLMGEGVPVLVHCSDGWDRTCQTISLAVVRLPSTLSSVTSISRSVVVTDRDSPV